MWRHAIVPGAARGEMRMKTHQQLPCFVGLAIHTACSLYPGDDHDLEWPVHGVTWTLSSNFSCLDEPEDAFLIGKAVFLSAAPRLPDDLILSQRQLVTPRDDTPLPL